MEAWGSNKAENVRFLIECYYGQHGDMLTKAVHVTFFLSDSISKFWNVLFFCQFYMKTLTYTLIGFPEIKKNAKETTPLIC